MNKIRIPIIPIVLFVVLSASSIFFYHSAGLERKTRLLKEQELIKRNVELQSIQAQIEESKQQISSIRESSTKRINAIEMMALEKEQIIKSLREEIDTFKKEKDAAIKDGLDKSDQIAELNNKITALNFDKEILAKVIEGLRSEIAHIKEAQSVGGSNSSELGAETAATQADSRQPYGMQADEDLGIQINAVDLGQIVVSKSSGRAARVQQVNTVYDFIIINAGQKDGVRDGTVMNIVRNNSLIGKAVVRQTRPTTCAALLLPEWQKTSIEKGDLITKF